MTPEEFVRDLGAQNERALSRLAPDATLAAEVSGALTVVSLLKVALKNELEATEIAARWLVASDDVDVKLALARQVGDEAKHYRMIADRLRELGFAATTFDPLATGYGPLFKYLDGLPSTVERVAAGQFTREAIAVVKNRQFIEFCDRAGDSVTATLYRDVIEPDERFHHELGRRLLLRLATTEAGQAKARAASARTLALAEELQATALRTAGIHHAPAADPSMAVADPSLDAFRTEVSRPDADIDLARAALAIARSEYPGLDERAYLRCLADLAREVDRGGRPVDALCRVHRLRERVFEDLGFRGNREAYFDPRNSFLNDVLDRKLGIPITLSVLLIEVGRRVELPLDGIGLPGHFITGAWVDGEQVLLDPFNGGALLTADACHDLVVRALGRPVALRPEHFAPVTSRQLLARMLANLKGIYWRTGQWAKVVSVIDRLLVLSPEAGGERRDRGIAWSRLGEVQRGVADWERYLTEFPNAPDHESVRAELRRVRERQARLN